MCIFLIMCTLYSYFIFVACFFLCLSAMCSFFRNSLFCGNFCCYWKGNCHKKWHSSHNSHMIIEYARNFRSILIWRLHNQRWIASDLFILIFAVFCMEISQRRHIHTHTHSVYNSFNYIQIQISFGSNNKSCHWMIVLCIQCQCVHFFCLLSYTVIIIRIRRKH